MFKFTKWQALFLGATLVSCAPPPDPESTETVEGDLTAGQYVLQNVNSKLCMDVTGNVTTTGAIIAQWDCKSGAQTQQWQFASEGGGQFEVKPAMTGTNQCLDV